MEGRRALTKGMGVVVTLLQASNPLALASSTLEELDFLGGQ